MTTDKEYQEVPQSEEKEPEKKKSIEDLVRLGRYAFLVLFYSEFVLLCGAGNMFFMIFAGAAPTEVSCIGKEIIIKDICKTGLDYRRLENCTLSMTYEFKSVNVEFNHLCKETALVKSSISVQMMGVLVGTLVTGMLSDRFGRLKVLTASYVLTMVFGLATTFAYDLTSFTIARAVQGPFVGGVIGTFFVYMTEQIPKQHRFVVTSIIAWSANFFLVSLIGMISHDWRTFQRNIVFASSPALIFYFFVYESPRWLVQHGHLKEARTILKKIHARDGLTDDNSKQIDELIDAEYQAQLASETKRKHYTMKHLFHTRKLGISVVVMACGTFITSMTNYSLVFNLDKLSGSIFMNTIILAVIRWAVNLLCGFLDYKVKCVGRKMVHFCSQASIATCVGIIAFIYIFGKEKEYISVVRVCTILATAFSTQVFITKSMVLIEIFPTVVRNQAMSFKSVFSRIGVIVAPQLFILSPFPVIPYIFLTVICVFDTILFQTVLPETKGEPLPDGMPEKERKEDKLVMTEKA